MATSGTIKQKFDELYQAWEAAISKPPIAFSSRPRDYTDIEPYRRIIALGKDALPFVLEKLEQGVFFMNEAALQLGEVSMDDVIAAERAKPPGKRMPALAQGAPAFLSEQQKARLILGHLRP